VKKKTAIIFGVFGEIFRWMAILPFLTVPGTAA